jgi:hypothetical protein
MRKMELPDYLDHFNVDHTVCCDVIAQNAPLVN